MKKEKFKVINLIRELILLIDSNMENFPKKEIELKNRIRINSYEKKKELITLILSKMKVIDFLLNLSYDKEIINQKQYYKFGTKMDDITKYACGWLKSLDV